MTEKTVTQDPGLKKAATDFMRLVASKDVREAYRRYAAPNCRHHNPHFKGDADSLMVAMEENALQNPDKKLDVVHAIQEGNLVAVHSRMRMKPGDPEYALVHIFRFQGDRVVELWDIAQAVPENSPNEHGMF